MTYDNLQLKLGDKVDTLDKKDISTIYIENKQLIILGKNTNELYREVFEMEIDTVRKTFRTYNIPGKRKTHLKISTNDGC